MALIFKKYPQKSQPAAVNINFGDAAVRQSLQDSINKSIAADPGLLRPFMAEDAADRVTINSKTNDPDLYWDHVARTNQLTEEVEKYREA